MVLRSTWRTSGSVTNHAYLASIRSRPHPGAHLRTPFASLGEQVDELEVLELGSEGGGELGPVLLIAERARHLEEGGDGAGRRYVPPLEDRKSTRLNSSHANISYAVFCLK